MHCVCGRITAPPLLALHQQDRGCLSHWPQGGLPPALPGWIYSEETWLLGRFGWINCYDPHNHNTITLQELGFILQTAADLNPLLWKFRILEF